MDLQKFKTFLKVAELGSLSRASDQIRIVQPALSRHIRLLEEEAGVTLFTRSSTGMHLTSAGKELRRRITDPIRHLDHAVADMKTLSDEASGRMTFAMLTTVSYAIGGRVACRVAKEMPGVSLRIIEGYSMRITESLQRGEVDAAITYGPGSDLHMMTEDLLLEELVLIGPPSSDLRADKPIEVSELAQLPLILPSMPNDLRHNVEQVTVKVSKALIGDVERAMAKAKKKLNVRIETDSFPVLTDLVASEIGFTILPLSSVFKALRRGELKYAPLKNPKVTRQLILARPLGSDLSYAAKSIISIARQELEAMMHEGNMMGHLLLDTKACSMRRGAKKIKKK